MATVLFYEKPGCINNTRQKAMLESSGHIVECINLLEYPWSKEELEQYLGTKPVSECFNLAAPTVKSGEIDPFSFMREDAIALMIEEPLLIKRPLMKIGNHYLQGFDITSLSTLISLEPIECGEQGEQSSALMDMNTCPHTNNLSCKKTE
ncbi:MAG: arsenate reductase family protein [Chlorobium sp.]|nr:MAG: arsenate reductase family protein [Chlorobium sp.]